MDGTFGLKLALCFGVGGVWVTLSTILSERFGSKVGGLIGGLPSTSLVALLFIGLTQSADMAAASSAVVPLAQAANGAFMLVFLLLVHRGLWRAIALALLTWFLGALFLVKTVPHGLGWSVGIWIASVMVVGLAVEKGMHLPSTGGRSIRYSLAQLLSRAGFGGAVIAFAVLMGRLGGPAYGGLFATFPALFLSTLILSHHSGGVDFCRAVAKSILFSGLITVPFYALLVRFSYPAWGLAWGTAAAMAGSAVVAYGTYGLIRRLT